MPTCAQVETNPEFNVCREAIDYLAAEIRQMELKLSEFTALGLPMQMIHGDLHCESCWVRWAWYTDVNT